MSEQAASEYETADAVIEFRKAAVSASYHHADDSGREWHLAKPHQRRCQELYNAATGDLKAYLGKIAGGYLISIRKYDDGVSP